MTDLFTPLTAATPTGARPKPHRHKWVIFTYNEAPGVDPVRYVACDICAKRRNEVVGRRGRLNRSRGNRIELEMARALGMRKVGQYGGAEDATSEPFVAQVKSKSGRAFPARWHDEISRLPVTAAQTPLLVIAEAGVVGRKRRALVVLRLEDWQSLHGSE